MSCSSDAPVMLSGTLFCPGAICKHMSTFHINVRCLAATMSESQVLSVCNVSILSTSSAAFTRLTDSILSRSKVILYRLYKDNRILLTLYSAVHAAMATVSSRSIIHNIAIAITNLIFSPLRSL